MVAEPEPGVALTTTMYPPVHVVFVLTNTMDVASMRELVSVIVCELPLATNALFSEVSFPVILFKVTAPLETVSSPYSNP